MTDKELNFIKTSLPIDVSSGGSVRSGTCPASKLHVVGTPDNNYAGGDEEVFRRAPESTSIKSSMLIEFFLRWSTEGGIPLITVNWDGSILIDVVAIQKQIEKINHGWNP